MVSLEVDKIIKARAVVARLQPYGIAHEAIVTHNAALGEKLFIIIGSAEKGRSRWNPFTFQERCEMVGLALEDAQIEAKILGLRDFGDNKSWVDEMVRLIGIPRSDIIVSSRNPYTQSACGDNGVLVYKHPIFFAGSAHPEGLSASVIRQRIALDLPWQNLVPRAVAKYLAEIIDGVETGIERICRTEAMPDAQKEPCRPEAE